MYTKLLPSICILFVTTFSIATDINSTIIQDENRTVVIENNDTKIQTPIQENNETVEIKERSSEGFVIFKLNLKTPCDMTSIDFAKNYTQEDWDEIYDADEFKKVVLELCPNIEGQYQDIWTSPLYQFAIKYASDVDDIPEC